MIARIFVIWVCFVFVVFISSAQSKNESKKKANPAMDWHLRAVDPDGFHGAEVWKAYEYLKQRQPKAKTIVAIIDGGVEISHEDLKASLWVNRGEIPGNGVDDDGNGYIDDVHGWNFAGNADGTQLINGSLEADREYLVLSGKFEGIDTSCLSRKGYKEYRYFKEEVEPFSSIWQTKQMIAEAEIAEKYAEQFEKELREKFPERKVFALKHFGTLAEENDVDTERMRAYNYFRSFWRKNPLTSWSKLYAKRKTLVKEAREIHQKQIDITVISEKERAALGDNQRNTSDRKYGNNNLSGEISSLHGMHVGGIVGATRNNGLGFDGVADVELMFIRLSEGNGDERDKDVASAIRYAVDNGARVINMSFGKRTSPGKKMVVKAMRYAEKKGVLLVHAAGNDGASLEVYHLYPSKHLTSKRDLTNWIAVGSIGMQGHPAKSSNYGKTEVDLFAPGDGVNSTVPHNKYRNLRGTSMAAPVVTGVIALIWNYFPELSAEEVKQAVLEGVTVRKGEMVRKPGQGNENIDFGELCVTGGVVNALEAVKIAESMSVKTKNR